MPQTRAAQASPAPSLTVLRPRWPLGIIVAMACLAQFMVVLDSAIVTLALPQMRLGLHLSSSAEQWVVSGYLITLGGLLLLAARAGDLYGRRKVFLFGITVFTLASLAGGLAANPATLLVARAVQGTGAAALAPTSLALIVATHSDAARRQRALTLWSVMGGAAGAAGVVLGGVLTAELNWRWVLFVNVPLGAVLFLGAVAALAPGRVFTTAGRLDLPGALTATLGVGTLTYGLSQAPSDGWGSVSVVAPLAAAAAFLTGFVVIEATGSRPLIPLALFRVHTLRIGNLIMLCMGILMTGAMYLISLYCQQGLGYSALRTGLDLLPMTLVLVAAGIGSRNLVQVLGARRQLVLGAVITAASCLWMTQLPDHSAYPTHILGPSLVAAVGMGLMLLPITLSATSGVSPENAGAASGLVNAGRQLGGAIGLAVLVTIATTITDHSARTRGSLAALVDGYHVAFGVSAAIMLVAALLALALPGRKAA